MEFSHTQLPQTHSKCIGRIHMSPSEYTYLLKCSYNDEFLDLLECHTKHNFIGNLEKPNGLPYFKWI